MKITTEKPPFWIHNRLKDITGCSFSKGMIVTIGDTIHAFRVLSDDVIAREKIHSLQQSIMGTEEWWKEYLINDRFRMSQDIESYREQYRYLKEVSNNHVKALRLSHRVSKELSTIDKNHNYKDIVKLIQG